MSQVWTVHGYRRTDCMFRVHADTEEEAIRAAKAGQYNDVDTEPGPDLARPAWTASKGWHLYGALTGETGGAL